MGDQWMKVVDQEVHLRHRHHQDCRLHHHHYHREVEEQGQEKVLGQ